MAYRGDREFECDKMWRTRSLAQTSHVSGVGVVVSGSLGLSSWMGAEIQLGPPRKR